MSVKFMKFIESSNKVLFFIAAIVLLSTIAYQFIKNNNRVDYTPPAVEIISEENEKEAVKFEKNYLGSNSELFVFEIISKKIKKTEANSYSMAAKTTSNWYLSTNVVNLLFTSPNGTNKLLLKEPALITEFWPSNDLGTSNEIKLNKNLYTIVFSDSNNDAQLSHEDSADFLISDFDGSNVHQVLADIKGFQMINDNQVLIAKADDFYLYRVEENELIKIDTDIARLNVTNN